MLRASGTSALPQNAPHRRNERCEARSQQLRRGRGAEASSRQMPLCVVRRATKTTDRGGCARQRAGDLLDQARTLEFVGAIGIETEGHVPLGEGARQSRSIDAR